jgi:CDP-diacylglycerol--glycerol-3-phosphate 3-phosphatidyltransferase
MDSHRYRWLPNAITVARLASVPILAYLAYSKMEGPFIALLTAALLSDVLDGWVARKFSAVSALGASLDSLADILLVLVIVYAIWPLHPYVYTAHGWVILAVVVLWTVAHAASLLRYGRLASFHTRLIRTGIFAFSLFALVLFVFGFLPWLLYLAAFICALGAIEHFIMLYLLPEWTPNLNGGIAEALKKRRANDW